MWRERILAALLLRNNAASDEAVRERLDDLRPLQLGTRAAIVIAALVTLVTGGPSALTTPWALLLIALVALHEWQTGFVRSACDARQLERRLLLAGLLMVGWSEAAREVIAVPLPLGLLPLALVIADFSLMLEARELLILLAAGALVAAAAVARESAGAALTDPAGVSSTWEFVAARTLAFAALALFAFLSHQRLRAARNAAQRALAELRLTEQYLSASHEQLTRMNDELAAEAEQEALLNRVTEILQNKRDGNELAHAMRVAAPMLGASDLVIVGTPHGSGRPRVLWHVRTDGGARLTDESSHGLLDAMLLAAPALVGDRPHPMMLGAGGEMELAASTTAAGIGAMMIAPMLEWHAQAGAMVVIAASDVTWGPADLELAERLAGAFASRLQADALSEMQERRIRELAALRQISEIMQSTVDTDRLLGGFARALRGMSPFTALYVARLDADGALLPVARFDSEGRALDDVPDDPDAIQHAWFSLREATVWSEERGASPSFYAGGEWPAVVIPMRPKGQVLGVVVATPAGPTGPDQAALLGQAVGQLAVALDSLTLYRQATVRAARIQVLGNLARILGSVLDLRDEFDAFAEEVRWLIPFERAMIMRIDAERGIAQPYVAYPRNDDLLAARETLSTSLARAAYESPQVVVLSRDDPRAAGCDWSLFDDATELAMVPIMSGDMCTAVFAVARADGQHYAADETGALEETAQLLAVSIERVELFQRAEHNATHDLLTGLSNYRGLQERIADVRLGIVEPGVTTVLMVDMDDLKVINDTLGHSVGDDVVNLVARVMREACRAEDFVGRVGGDEFVIVMEGVNVEAGVLVAERIHAMLRDAPLAIGEMPRAIRVSAGVAAAPRDADSMAELLQVADAAMYEAKFAGGGRTAVAGAGAGTRGTGSLRGRPDRLVETMVRVASAGATIEEREAITLAQRYVLATATRVGLPAPESEVLKMLVARHAAPRLVEPRQSLDRTLAFMALDGLAVEWATRAGESAAVAQILIAAATDLAWLQMPAPAGAGCNLDEAILRLVAGRDGVLDSVLLRELSVAARAGAQGHEQHRPAAA